ncbi:exopolysaccharide biosynthesis polyprenyl glycosylphosphotransferase [Caulobacter mirabilis]|uniref:Bacterial sugar transferase domain-containing protein n=1 Tax=Caulobacter mirabilis TaxID=69666 RepID=A0A2D2AXJ5_9CAUL|nr:exopolysaccharide biosynthesis polyprenyl glycosylphosphotransferase [Caulobacter mirabilis]ATQ42695.1 hypothetical protein CSW64_09860 [Caulobacter mirabilis]
MSTAAAARDHRRDQSEEDWLEAARALRQEVESGFQPDVDPQGKDRRGPFRPHRLTPVRARLELRQITGLFRLADAAVAALAAAAVLNAVAPGGLANATLAGAAPALLGVGLLIWSLHLLGAYAFGPREGLMRHLTRTAAAFGLAGLTLAAALLLPAAEPLRAPAIAWFCITFCALMALNGGWWAMVRGWRREGKLTPNIVIVGATPAARTLIDAALESRDVAVLGIFDDRIGRVPNNLSGVPVLGDTADLLGHKVLPYVDRIVIAVPASAENRIAELIRRLRVLPNDVSLVLDAAGSVSPNRTLSRIADAQVAQLSGGPTDARRAAFKRAQDLAVGALALLLAWPIMLAVALFIKLDSPGPVFFRQRRHGFNNEEILVWKFRSMRQETADATAARQVTAGDDRVTRVGRFIRKTSLDELPQLFNVLVGEMSLVGPRPHAIGMKTGEIESARIVAEYAHRHRMKPGMTGWAAINGSRGPVDTPELVRRRVALDIDYIERQSFWFDLYIMAMTIPCLLGDRQAVR